MSEIETILTRSKTVAIVGLSSRRDRPSYRIGEYLQGAGYRIIPVNPNQTEVLGEKAYARLEDVPEKIDVVDIFRRSEFVLPVVEAAIRVGARAVGMQEGVMDEQAAQLARDTGLLVVRDRCMLKQHRRWVAERRQAAPTL